MGITVRLFYLAAFRMGNSPTLSPATSRAAALGSTPTTSPGHRDFFLSGLLEIHLGDNEAAGLVILAGTGFDDDGYLLCDCRSRKKPTACGSFGYRSTSLRA